MSNRHNFFFDCLTLRKLGYEKVQNGKTAEKFRQVVFRRIPEKIQNLEHFLMKMIHFLKIAEKKESTFLKKPEIDGFKTAIIDNYVEKKSIKKTSEENALLKEQNNLLRQQNDGLRNQNAELKSQNEELKSQFQKGYQRIVRQGKIIHFLVDTVHNLDERFKKISSLFNEGKPQLMYMMKSSNDLSCENTILICK